LAGLFALPYVAPVSECALWYAGRSILTHFGSKRVCILISPLHYNAIIEYIRGRLLY